MSQLKEPSKIVNDDTMILKKINSIPDWPPVQLTGQERRRVSPSPPSCIVIIIQYNKGKPAATSVF